MGGKRKFSEKSRLMVGTKRARLCEYVFHIDS